MTQYVTVDVAVPPDVLHALEELAARCNQCTAIGEGFASHGTAFTPAKLLAMLAEDAGKIVSDPESWQSANLRHVLASHGYWVNRT